MKVETHLPPAEYEREHPVLANPGESRSLQHLPQLDGVRAIAVLLVLWYHFGPPQYVIPQGPAWGAIGVGLFFTLSGFLITRILLNCRLKIANKSASMGSMFKQFYARRFLRIFPLYYGVLFVLLIFNPTKFRHRFIYNALYLTNYRMAYWPKTDGGIERHLWSLSVEEQFYLAWPLLIFLTPRKLLLPLMLLTILVGPAWRAYMYTPKLLIHEWMTPGCLDLLGMGALLALLSLPQFGLSRLHAWFVDLCGIVGIPLFVWFVATKSTIYPIGHGRYINFGLEWAGGATYAVTAVAAVWLIGMASRGFKGPIGWLLTFAPLVYIGRISYGLYVLHMFVPHLLAYLFPHLNFKSYGSWGNFLGFTTISIGLASVSWFAFEAPINRLKRYFEYDRTARTNPSTSETPASTVGT
ncbi:MAG: acyltransferase family protein [Tepidisphaeraceae bacterium]